MVFLFLFYVFKAYNLFGCWEKLRGKEIISLKMDLQLANDLCFYLLVVSWVQLPTPSTPFILFYFIIFFISPPLLFYFIFPFCLFLASVLLLRKFKEKKRKREGKKLYCRWICVLLIIYALIYLRFVLSKLTWFLVSFDCLIFHLFMFKVH